MRSRTRSEVLLLTVITIAGGLCAQAQTPAMKRIGARVTYVTPSSAYCNKGSDSGFAVGDTLVVLRNLSPRGRIVVSAISSTSLAGAPVSDTSAVAIGDSVYTDKRIEDLPARPTAQVTSGESRPGLKRTESIPNNVTGRVAVQYAGAGVLMHKMDFSQPSLLVQLNITGIFGTGANFTMYTRSSYDLSDQFPLYGSGSRFNARTYEMSVNYNNAQSPITYSVGRILSTYLGGLGQFDGGQFAVKTGGVTVGVAAGTQADPRTSSVSLENQKGVAFVNYGWGGDVFTRSDMTVAYGQQLYKGKFDRDFLYTQASIRPTEKVSFYESSEFDVHDLVNGQRVARPHLTSAFATVNYSPLQWVSVNAGYDATRLIYLFETMRSVPDSLLNLETQHGYRIGLTVRLPLRIMLFTNTTFRPSGAAPNAHTINTSIRMSDIASTGFSAGAQVTSTIGQYTNGQGMTFDLDRWFSSAVVVGMRLDHYRYTIKSTNEQIKATTLTLNTNVRLTSALYLLLSGDQVWDSLRKSQRVYLEFGVHF